MNTHTNYLKILALTVLTLTTSSANADYLHITFEPQKVYQVSSKTEGAWATCQMCQGKIRYERTWRRNHVDGSWIETTTGTPTHCRKCKSKVQELDKYRAEEARLDMKLTKKALKERISAKKRLLRN